MLSSINPLGERARGQKFWITVSWYLLGSLMGGIFLGALGGLAGSWLPGGDWRLLVAAAVALTGAGLDLARKPPPSIQRQVDENWLTRYRGWVYGFGFGIQLGFGMVTIVTSASVYSMALLTVLSGSVVAGAVIGAAFGLVRASVIVMVVGADEPGALRGVMRQLQGHLPAARWSVVGTQLLTAAVALAVIA